MSYKEKLNKRLSELYFMLNIYNKMIKYNKKLNRHNLNRKIWEVQFCINKIEYKIRIS